MVNAWSLAGSILSGTFDEDYPIVKNEVEHSDYYYDYKRNDPDAENPFTDPKDRERADFVVGAGNTAVDKDLEWIEKSGGYEWTPGSPWPPEVPEDDGLDYEVNYYGDYMADVDDQRSHHFTITSSEEDDVFKYSEDEILKDVKDYIASTYSAHYTSKGSQIQTLDLIESIGDAESFCRANAIKYLSRFGKKNGKYKFDLFKAMHYCTLLYYFSGLTNESIDSNETI
tara:strand:- start:1170 stop:1850 length:681 start_codon:yes stop_codon:yes gene_type:complete